MLCIYLLYLLYIGFEMKKLIEFKEMCQDIQLYADNNCDGNFSQAVRQLVKLSLRSDKNEG